MAKVSRPLEDYHRQLSHEGSQKFARFEELIQGLQLRRENFNREYRLYAEDPETGKTCIQDLLRETAGVTADIQ